MGKGDLREKLQALAERVLAELAPERCVARVVRRKGDELWVGPYRYNLQRFRHILMIGFGKASARMARGLVEVLGDHLTKGLVVTVEGYGESVPGVEIVNAGHPLPDERTIQASQNIMSLVRGVEENDLLLVLVSGGGSALFELPLPDVSLEDLRRTTELLMRAGATIQELNVVRKHLSLVKGGRLAQAAYPGTVLSLVLSDVPGDSLATIASGPTFPDPTTFAEALAVLRARGLWEEVPNSVREQLMAGATGRVPETPKPGDPCFAKVRHVLIGSGRTALAFAQKFGRELGFRPLVLTSTLRGEAREVGRVLAGLAEEVQWWGRPVRPPALLLAAGETTVTVRGNGRGGRNQELALSFAQEIRGLSRVALLALATDGKDGPTDAAGALVDGATWERAVEAGVDPAQALAENDSYRALSAAGDLLRTGPTGTNVADLVMLGVERRHDA